MDFKDLYDGKNISNMSFVEEVQKNQQNLRDMARAEAIKQDPTLNYVQRQLASGLLGAKMDWQRAYDAGDANGMATAALNAQDLRNRAESIGWNGNGYGSDVSLLEAAQNLANNDTRAVNDILYNLKDSNDIYQQKVVDYLDKGYSIDSAKRMAGQRSNEATASNVNQLRDAFRMYGMDERGAITPQGADILASLGLNGQGELANYYANMLAKPVQNWNFENSLITADRGQQNALQRQAMQNAYNTERQQAGFAHDVEMANLHADLDVKKRTALASVERAFKQMEKEDAYNFAITTLIKAGFSPQEAAQIAAKAAFTGKLSAGGGGAGSNGNGGKSGGMKISDANTIINQYNKWIEDHPDAPIEANPFADGYEEAKAVMNGYTEAPADVDNYNMVNSWAQNILEENYRRGYPLSEDELYKVIASVGGYGEQVANEYKKSGALKSYGK